jgi:hypothetical protein
MVSTLEAEDRGTATSDRKGNLPVMQSIGAFILAAIEALCVVYLSVAKAGFILAAAAVASSAWSTVLHRDIIRIPMLLVSTLGALVNLYLLWKAHRLRNAPAAAWRRQPLKKVDRWRIGVVLASSLLALGLTAMEIFFHRIIHHTLV